MRHPFWIINSTFLLFILGVLFFMFFSRINVPEREEITPVVSGPVKKEETVQINISKIYENDIFDTYHKELPPPEPAEQLPVLPEPPKPEQVEIPEIPAPQFLEPLNITLKGIIVLHHENGSNKAIIMDNKTNIESTYKTGDYIEDGQLVRIFNKKIIIVRSSGQQEVLYLREQDAKDDPAYAIIDNWEDVAQQLSDDQYVINPQTFTDHVTSLAQFIDLLGLTTAYKQGMSVGCAVGHVPEKSLGLQLGLQTGDIISAIDGIPATTTENRLKIYHAIISANDGQTIDVELIRRKEPRIMHYKLKNFYSPKISEPLKEQAEGTVLLQTLKEEEKNKIMEKESKLAPTNREIRKRERQQMLNYRNK